MNNRWSAIRNIILFILILEAFFWLGSWFNQGAQFVVNFFQVRTKSNFRIMCVGDSITQWGEDNSYPAQLQRMINQRSQNIKYQVINQGVAGANSASVLINLPNWIKSYKPDMVIIMIGVMDGFDKTKDKSLSEQASYINKIKVYRVLVKLLEAITAKFEEILTHFKSNSVTVTKAEHAQVTYEEFQNAIIKESESQTKLYVLIKLAEGTKRSDIAEALYEKFLQNNKSEIIHKWVVQQYGRLLINMKQYDKFVYVMPTIPYDGWPNDWIKGYCHGESNMEHVRQIIERMVQNGEETLIYRNIVSCYEEGGNQPLANFYITKLITTSTGVYSQETKQNFIKIKNLLFSKNIGVVLSQYPMRDIKELLAIFEDETDYGKIIFVNNGPIFRDAINKEAYNTYFVDRARADFGHCTPKGNHLLAENIAKVLHEKIFYRKFGSSE